MKRILLFLSIIFIVPSCCNNDINEIPEEDLTQIIKALYDSELGGVKEQILAAIEIYECLEEPGCNVSTVYMDTVYTILDLEEISHKKNFFYTWEFISNGSPNTTALEVIVSNTINPCSFKHSDFSYNYYMDDLLITIEDDVLDDFYQIELDIYRPGNYEGNSLDLGFISTSTCSLRVSKLDFEIQAHICNDKTTIPYGDPCGNGDIMPISYDRVYSIH